jgi:uncharacterized protein (TIGR00106 family)
MVVMEFSLFPLDKGVSLSPYVARSLEIVEQSGLDYRLTAMGTIVEGELERVLDVMRQCLEAMASDCERISCSAKLDYRAGKQRRLNAKVESVEAKVGHSLKK